MTPDEIIEVLQGAKVGRKWGIRFRSTGELVEQASQDPESLCRCIIANDVERVELMPLPDEITLPARVIPAPLREPLIHGAIYYTFDPLEPDGVACHEWGGGAADNRLLACGVAFSTKQRAAAAWKAMCPYA